jgi:hypothetical protein
MVWIGWLMRVGRVTTTQGVRTVVTSERMRYELRVKRIFKGSSSFGTYLTVGRWNSTLLRDRTTGMLWAVLGPTRDLPFLSLDV